MPVHPFDAPAGRVETIEIDSKALRGNLLGDPTRRRVAVYLPPGYDDADADYPLFVCLAGFTGSGLKQLNWRAFDESLPQRLDRLVGSGAMGPVVLAMPDGFTSLGGNQYVNSLSLGLWEDFLLDEMLPALERAFRVRATPSARAVFGKSSGGYGALIQGMLHGDSWGAVACHSGDMGFDLLYRRDLPLALDVLAPHGGSTEAFIDHLRASTTVAGHEFHALMVLAMAASYDPDPDAPFGIRLPVDPQTAELDAKRWSSWLAHDPHHLVLQPGCRDSLRGLRMLYIDCGARDQYFLHYGNRGFVRRLAAHEIPHRYEEFDGTHSGIDHRLDVSLPLLFDAVGSRTRGST